jgi:hypothetical protein
MRMNSREFTRANVPLYAELRVRENEIIRGKLENVSFSGLLLNCDDVLPEQTPCLVVLYLNEGQSAPAIKARGLVIRHDGHSLAVQFLEIIGMESATHLANLVLYNSGNLADCVEAEFESHVGLKAKS